MDPRRMWGKPHVSHDRVTRAAARPSLRSGDKNGVGNDAARCMQDLVGRDTHRMSKEQRDERWSSCPSFLWGWRSWGKAGSFTESVLDSSWVRREL